MVRGWESKSQKRTTEIQNPHAHSTIWEHFEAFIDAKLAGQNPLSGRLCNNRNNTTDQPPLSEVKSAS
ncbi:MAG: hypothetical protein PUP91_09225 [Rhizonema sp. PD37]|nr:hypothetical protein [Rhizonema sp. PD37]